MNGLANKLTEPKFGMNAAKMVGIKTGDAEGIDMSVGALYAEGEIVPKSLFVAVGPAFRFVEDPDAKIYRLVLKKIESMLRRFKYHGILTASCIIASTDRLPVLQEWQAAAHDNMFLRFCGCQSAVPEDEAVSELNPDAVVMATGSVPLLPDIPGVHLSHVVQAVDVLMATVKIDDKAVIIGGGTVGCEVAIFLAEKGVDVTLLETLPYVAHGIPRLVGKMIKDKMIELGVEIMTNRKVVHISEELVVYEDAEAKRASLPAVHVVLAIGSRPRNELAAALRDLPGENYLIGDCLEPRRALEAIFEGAEVGLQL